MGFWPFSRDTSIPTPSGGYAIGTTRFDVTSPRRVPVQAWYPATPSTATREPYLDDDVRAALAALTHVPKVLLPKNPSHSVVDAPAVQGRFPVLVFNHGFAPFQKQSTSLYEELASHGYVVMSIGHPGTSLVVRFADGSTTQYDAQSPAWKSWSSGIKTLEQQVKEVAPLLQRARVATSLAALRDVITELSQHAGYVDLLPVLDSWSADTRAVFDALDGGLPSALKAIVEPSQLGVFGHSLGGMLSGRLAMTEPRVRAGMNYDGAQLPEAHGDYALKAPFCFLYADTTRVGQTSVTNEGMNDALVIHGPKGSCSAVIAGSTHLNFTDMNNLPMARSMLGTIERGEMAKVLRATTLGFFNHHLKNLPLTGFATSTTLRVLQQR